MQSAKRRSQRIHNPRHVERGPCNSRSSFLCQVVGDLKIRKVWSLLFVLAVRAGRAMTLDQDTNILFLFGAACRVGIGPLLCDECSFCMGGGSSPAHVNKATTHVTKHCLQISGEEVDQLGGLSSGYARRPYKWHLVQAANRLLVTGGSFGPRVHARGLFLSRWACHAFEP